MKTAKPKTEIDFCSTCRDKERCPEPAGHQMKANCHIYAKSGDNWWASHQPEFYGHPMGICYFEVIALSDGRYSIKKSCGSIMDGDCVFPDRNSAIRASAARLISKLRAWYRNDSGTEEIINWVLGIVQDQTGDRTRKIRALRPLEETRKAKETDLFYRDLFDYAARRTQ